jgi:hypothetical protein
MTDAIPEFKLRARKLLYSSHLADFPVMFQMYAASFGIYDDAQLHIDNIMKGVRNSPTPAEGFSKMCNYLDRVELQENTRGTNSG